LRRLMQTKGPRSTKLEAKFSPISMKTFAVRIKTRAIYRNKKKSSSNIENYFVPKMFEQ